MWKHIFFKHWPEVKLTSFNQNLSVQNGSCRQFYLYLLHFGMHFLWRFLPFVLLLPLICTQRQRVDGGENRQTSGQQQYPQRHLPNPNQSRTKYGQQVLSHNALHAQQQQQQQQYYSYGNTADYSQSNNYGPNSASYTNNPSLQYAPAQQSSSGYYYYPQQQQQSPYSYGDQSRAYAYGVQQVGASQGAGGQYGYGPQQPQPIPISQLASTAQQVNINSGAQYGGYNQAAGVSSQSAQFGGQNQFSGNQVGLGQNGQFGTEVSQAGDRLGQFGNQLYLATPPPINLPPHPPTLPTLFPSGLPTPPPQPIYDPEYAKIAANQPYEKAFDFAPGTPIIYCGYNANPLPVYNTNTKKCIPYHPLCGITFTCIFDIDPRTGRVWRHAEE